MTRPSSLNALLSALVLVVSASTFARAEGALPSVFARYEIVRAGGVTEHLDILRTDSRIEHRVRDGELIEVWERDERGEVSHLKIFPKAQRVVHYTAGDLRTLHVEPNWEELGALIGGGGRSELKRTGVARHNGRPATRLVGSLYEEPASLLWLSRDSLPAQLVIGRGATKRTMKLVSLVPCAPRACVPTTTDSYREIEFADLGDAEHDPFVRRFVAAIGFGDGS